MKSLVGPIAATLIAVSTQANADITGIYVGPNAALTMKVEVASNGDARGETSPNSYFLTHDGQAYIVQATFNGPAVMRLEDIALVMAEQVKSLMPKLPAGGIPDTPAFEVTKGGSVIVRGRPGTAYYMGGKATVTAAEKPMIVISDDPKLAPLGAAMQKQFDMSVTMMGKVMGHSNAFKGVQDALKSGAPLIFTGLELDTVSTDPIPAQRFALPAPPLSIDGVRKNMGAAG